MISDIVYNFSSFWTSLMVSVMLNDSNNTDIVIIIIIIITDKISSF